MPTYCTTKAFTTGTWVQFDLTKLPKGMCDVTIYPKATGVGVTINTTTPTNGIGATDPIFYIDANAISQFTADPCTIWIWGAATNQTSIIASNG